MEDILIKWEGYHLFKVDLIWPWATSVSWCPGSVGEHMALKHQRWILPVDEAEKRGFGCGSVQTGATATRSAHPEPAVR